MAKFQLYDRDPSAVTNLIDDALDSPADSLTPGKPWTPGEILDPITGELIAINDIDSLIDALDRINRRDSELYAAKTQIRQCLAELVKDGTTKTRRVQGKRRKAIVNMPDDAWEQGKLKEAFNSFPHLRDQCLKIDSIGVKLREWKKLVETAGNPDLETFKSMIAAANRGPQGLPSVKIEE